MRKVGGTLYGSFAGAQDDRFVQVWSFRLSVVPVILTLTPNVAVGEGEESTLRGKIFGRPLLRDMDLKDCISLSRMEIDEFHQVEMGIKNKSSP